jgi:hypothetical protein
MKEKTHLTRLTECTTLPRGIATVWAVVAIPTAVTLLCVVIEVAHLWLSKIELQNALNAAALAGVKRWGDISEITSAPSPFHDTPGAFSITQEARDAAVAAAAGNTVSGQPVVLDRNEADDGIDDVGYDNASCTGDIILGGFPTDGSTAFTTAASVGCGRTTTGGTIDMDIKFYLQVETPGAGMSATNTSSAPQAFRISYEITSITGAMASDISLVTMQMYLRNDGLGTGVFDPDTTVPINEWTGLESGSGATVDNTFTGNTYLPAPFSSVPAGSVTFSYSDYVANPFGAGIRPTRLAAAITSGVWNENETLVFGIDTDGVRVDDPPPPAATTTDRGGNFGESGAASGTDPAMEVDFLFQFNTPLGTSSLQSLDLLMQRIGNTEARLQGNAQKNFLLDLTVVVPDEAFAVLTQKTVNVTPICTQIFGVPLGTIPVSGRAVATGRCRGSSTTDPIVLNPQGVHFTSVSCSVP